MKRLMAILFFVALLVGRLCTQDAVVIKHKAAPSNPNLVGWWPLNEGGAATTAIDKSGNGNTGTWYGTQSCTGSYYTTGLSPLVYAGCFDGSTNSVNVGSSASLNPITAFTMSAWVKPSFSSTGSSGEHEIISRDDATLGRVYDLQYNDNGSNGWAIWISPYIEAYYNAPVVAGTWYHICVSGTATGGGGLYLNGVQEAAPTVFTMSSSTGPTEIGARSYSGYPSPWAGDIEDARIYNDMESCPAIYAAGPQS